MALIGINPTQREQKESTLDKILKGVQIAQGVMGTAIAIPEFLQKRELNKAQIESEKTGITQRASEIALKGRELDIAEKKLNKPDLGDQKVQLEIDQMKREMGEPSEEDITNFKNIWGGKYAVPKTKGEVQAMIKMGRMNDREQLAMAIAMGNFKLAQDAAARASRKEAADTLEKNAPKPDQLVAAGFATRADESAKIVDKLQNIGAASTSRLQNIAPKEMQSSDFQQLDQAQRDFINAVLRRESGASISPAEFDNARQQYFPQPGDTPEVLEQKLKNRQQSIASLKAQAGENALNKVLQEKSKMGVAGSLGQVQTKVIDGVTYKKVPGGWQAQ